MKKWLNILDLEATEMGSISDKYTQPKLACFSSHWSSPTLFTVSEVVFVFFVTLLTTKNFSALSMKVYLKIDKVSL